MKKFFIVLVIISSFSGCNETKSPVSSGDPFIASSTFENDTIALSLKLTKEWYSDGDPLNAEYSITNKTNRLYSFTFDTSNIFYTIRNDSSRVIMNYPPANAHSSGSLTVPANSSVRITINEPLNDNLHIPLRTGKYTLTVWLEEAQNIILPAMINVQ